MQLSNGKEQNKGLYFLRNRDPNIVPILAD